VGQQVERSRDGIYCLKGLDDGGLRDVFHFRSLSMMSIEAAYHCSRENAMMGHILKLQRPRSRQTAVSNDDGERCLYCLMMTMIFHNFVDRKECPADSGALERGRKPCLGIEDAPLNCSGVDNGCYC
jgi:hypothetical protein